MRASLGTLSFLLLWAALSGCTTDRAVPLSALPQQEAPATSAFAAADTGSEASSHPAIFIDVAPVEEPDTVPDSTLLETASPAVITEPPVAPSQPPVVAPPPTARPDPPATAEGPSAPLAPSNQHGSPAFTLPATAWAQEELARRGFVRDAGKRVIVIDPGHGGPEVGSAGGGVSEKNVNLAIARKLRALLETDGFQVLLTRESDSRVYNDPTPGSSNPLRADLQARIDLANAAQASLFVSVHNNGSSNRGESGTEVWYAPDRPFGHQNFLLAKEVLAGIIGELQGAGYPTVNRGLKNGSEFRVFNGRVFPLFVLGNARTEPRPTRATMMPGILGESLFLSNASEASVLAQDGIQAAIARGYRNGIVRYFTQ